MESSWSANVLIVEDLGQQRLPAQSLAAVLRHAGLRVQLVDLNEGAPAIITRAERKRPRLVISSVLFADRVDEHIALLSALRGAEMRSHLTMVGPLPTFAFAELLTACPALDSVLRGEAEASVVQLATTIDDPNQWQTVPGLAFRSPSIRTNPLPRPISRLDDLPFPTRDEKISCYRGYGFATVEASRGCYHACAFCLPCAFYRRQRVPYRLRSIAKVVDEIEDLYRRGTRLFLFDDEQFLAPARMRGERIATLRDELERRNLRIAFTIKCRADDVDAELFHRLKEMGLLRVYVGIESGCQATLDRLNKGVTVRQNAKALAVLDELNIVSDFHSLLFHPWSTLENIEMEIAFLQQVLLHLTTPLDFREVQVYPGTLLARQLWDKRPSHANSWPLIYTITDPRAELLRRLGRLVFNSSRVYTRLQNFLTEAWYDLLLARRFHPSPADAEHACQLKQTAARVNIESLSVWREMLAFAGTKQIYAAEQVNRRACAWVEYINTVYATCSPMSSECE